MKSSLLYRFCFFLLSVAMVLPLAHGQATTGSITGQVEDATGAIIPNAQITATEVNKGTAFHGRSNSAGSYVVLNADPRRLRGKGNSTRIHYRRRTQCERSDRPEAAGEFQAQGWSRCTDGDRHHRTHDAADAKRRDRVPCLKPRTSQTCRC